MAQRRVVVTGVGLISSVGTGTEEVLVGPTARGKWHSARSRSSTPQEYAARIAGEVKNFDPLAYVDKKELKKMGRFIQFAIAASEFAVKVGESRSERSGFRKRRRLYRQWDWRFSK
jgi:3-oxoacyl-[acyl-carrier-protein] synthase II